MKTVELTLVGLFILSLSLTSFAQENADRQKMALKKASELCACYESSKAEAWAGKMDDCLGGMNKDLKKFIDGMTEFPDYDFLEKVALKKAEILEVRMGMIEVCDSMQADIHADMMGFFKKKAFNLSSYQKMEATYELKSGTDSMKNLLMLGDFAANEGDMGTALGYYNLAFTVDTSYYYHRHKINRFFANYQMENYQESIDDTEDIVFAYMSESLELLMQIYRKNCEVRLRKKDE